MAKSVKKTRKLSTNEALESLLGHKAAKRLRKLATQLAAADARKKRRRGAKRA